ncbi:alpha/beta hydrolase family protein [Deinococcus apachensis]|uniref:alpha/beta hydrolase family protein n=1 Tax=Deinococcus apachensis TaxID=309886 RepID=UPI000365193D|nr:alpha/beta fold hydrolase [Deinococcus apachensis]
MNRPIRAAETIPVSAPTPVVSVAPVVLSSPGRAVDLQVRVSAPVTGGDLPVILLSHGHGNSNNLSSLNGYGPLANFWAAHGFVVIQPTHLSSMTLRGIVDASDPEAPLFWRSRAEDMRRILAGLDVIEASVPGLLGRLDRNRIAVAGHSLGGLTAGMLLGERVTDERGVAVDMADARIKAGVILAAPGSSVDPGTFAAQRYPVLRNLSFAEMTTPALVVVGDRDVNPNFSERVDYRADAYRLSPGPKCLLTLFGAGHLLGGISGYDAAETNDESPERVEAVGRLTWAYLRTALSPGDPAWSAACAALMNSPDPLGRVECK